MIIILSFVLIGCENRSKPNLSVPIRDTITIIKTHTDTILVPAIQTDTSAVYPENIEIPEVVGGLAYNGTKKEKGMLEESGVVRYHVPDSMKIGREYNANIRISKEKDTAKITINMPEGKTECVKVGSTMEVKLIDPEVTSFEITPLNSEIQTIEDDGDFTAWEWTVKPLKGGNHKLKLLITIKSKDLIKDIPVFNKDIYVQASPVYSIKKIIVDNWAVLLPSVFIPLIGGIWHLFFRKKKKPSDYDDED